VQQKQPDPAREPVPDPDLAASNDPVPDPNDRVDLGRAMDAMLETGHASVPPDDDPATMAQLANLPGMLRAASFPASRDDLVRFLIDRNANAPLVEAVAALPDGGVFRDRYEVARALGVKSKGSPA
jgi:Protein of unknown function (DUF2795)